MGMSFETKDAKFALKDIEFVWGEQMNMPGSDYLLLRVGIEYLEPGPRAKPTDAVIELPISRFLPPLDATNFRKTLEYWDDEEETGYSSPARYKIFLDWSPLQEE